MGFVVVLYIAVIVLVVAGAWKVFTKAGQPGWAAIVPIYNTYVMSVEICKLPILWFVLSLIPFVNFIAAIVICINLAKVFGKEGGFIVGLILLPMIFVPILGFGDAKYQGGAAAAPPVQPPVQQ